MSNTVDRDGRENPYEIDPNDIVENAIESCPELQQYQQYVWCEVSRIKKALEASDPTAYIPELNRLDDAVPYLCDFTAYALISAIVHEPMAQEVIEDGLKGKPAEYRAYFEQLKNCGTIPPSLQPHPDTEGPDVTES